MKTSKVYLLGLDERERSLAGITVKMMRKRSLDGDAEILAGILATIDAGQHLDSHTVEVLRLYLEAYGPTESTRSGEFTDQGVVHRYTYSIVEHMCTGLWSLVR